MAKGESEAMERIDPIDFLKRLRAGENVCCPECHEGNVSTEYDPETSHFFSCDKCDFKVNID